MRKIINQQGASDSERGVSPSDGSDVSRSKNGGNEVTFRSMGLGESEILAVDLTPKGHGINKPSSEPTLNSR